jgi:hypothetical protein
VALTPADRTVAAAVGKAEFHLSINHISPFISDQCNRGGGSKTVQPSKISKFFLMQTRLASRIMSGAFTMAGMSPTSPDDHAPEVLSPHQVPGAAAGGNDASPHLRVFPTMSGSPMS